jgi:hypothetical protein
MNVNPLPMPLSTLAIAVITAVAAGCTTVEYADGGDGTLLAEPAAGMILPKSVERTESTVSCDFGEVVTACPVIEAKGPAGTAIKYRTYSDAADAAESVFELPDLACDDKATDLMDRIVLVTATHQAKSARKFRFLDIELSNGVDILRTGGMPISSQASP